MAINLDDLKMNIETKEALRTQTGIAEKNIWSADNANEVVSKHNAMADRLGSDDFLSQVTDSVIENNIDTIVDASVDKIVNDEKLIGELEVSINDDVINQVNELNSYPKVISVEEIKNYDGTNNIVVIYNDYRYYFNYAKGSEYVFNWLEQSGGENGVSLTGNKIVINIDENTVFNNLDTFNFLEGKLTTLHERIKLTADKIRIYVYNKIVDTTA